MRKGTGSSTLSASSSSNGQPSTDQPSQERLVEQDRVFKEACEFFVVRLIPRDLHGKIAVFELDHLVSFKCHLNVKEARLLVFTETSAV